MLSEVGPSLQPHQLGVGVRGGSQVVGHAVRAGSASTELVTLRLDIMNAFNSMSRSTMLEQLFERVPSLGPYAAYAYGLPSKLYVDGAPAGSAPLVSSDGMRQGDPSAPLMFALALQPVLEVASGAHRDCSTVVYVDDICIQGPQQAAECAFRHLCAGPLPLRLRVKPAICKLYGADAAVATESAANLGCQEDTPLVIAGTPAEKPTDRRRLTHVKVRLWRSGVCGQSRRPGCGLCGGFSGVV